MELLVIAYLLIGISYWSFPVFRSAVQYVPFILVILLGILFAPFYFVYMLVFNFKEMNHPGLYFFMAVIIACGVMLRTGYSPF